MVKKVSIILLALGLILTACGQSGITAVQAPSSAEAVSGGSSIMADNEESLAQSVAPESSIGATSEILASSPVTIEMKHFYLSGIIDFLNLPSSFEDKILASSAKTYRGEAKTNIIEFDISNQKETELPFYCYDPRADENYYYMVEYSNGENDAQTISVISIDKSTSQRKILYTLPKGNDIIPRLAYGDGYLAWTELVLDHGEVSCYRICSLNCETAKVMVVDETKYSFGGFYIPVINNGYLSYADKTSDGYVIKAAGLQDNKIQLEVPLGEAPMTSAFDGTYLVWDTAAKGPRNLQIYNVKTKEQKTIDKDTTGLDIYKSRYIVYCKNNQVYVYDIISADIIFTTQTKANTDDETVRYVEWFIMDKQTGRAIFNSYKKGSEYTYAISVLDFKEAAK